MSSPCHDRGRTKRAQADGDAHAKGQREDVAHLSRSCNRVEYRSQSRKIKACLEGFFLSDGMSQLAYCWKTMIWRREPATAALTNWSYFAKCRYDASHVAF